MMGKEEWVMRIEEEEALVKELERPQVPMQQPSTDDWVTRIRSELGDSHSQSHHQQQRRPCIYPVPAWLKDLHPGAYEPRIVSIGPYHYGNPKLKPMEKHKHRALLTFLRRAKENNPEPLDAIKEAMKAVVEQLKSSYEGLEDLSYYLDFWETKESLEERFLQLMIVDGCFILELLRVRMARQQGWPSGYEDTDPVFGEHGIIYLTGHLGRDMLMLENQLPMLALTTIADAAQIGLLEEQLIKQIQTFLGVSDDSSTSPDMQKKHWFKRIRTFFCDRLTNNNNSTSSRVDDTPKSSGSGSSETNEDSLHIMHEYIKCKTRIGDYFPTDSDMRWSATELYEGGVKFRMSEHNSFKDISFDPSKGILSLPHLFVGDGTEAVLLNLMAFESLHVGAGNAVTAYVNLMDMLIDSPRDVELLRNKEIVKGWVGSDENIANIFNHIAKQTIVKLWYRDGVDNQLSNYRKKRRHRWRASFVHTYLRNPWVFISLLGALILLFLTILQDIYTVLPYYTK